MQPAWVTGGLRSQREVHCHTASRSGRTTALNAGSTVQHRPRRHHWHQVAKLISGRRHEPWPHAAASDSQAISSTDAGSPSHSSDSSTSGVNDFTPSPPMPTADPNQQPPSATSPDISPQEAQRRLERAASLLQMIHMMVPGDPDTFNPALALWYVEAASAPSSACPRTDVICHTTTTEPAVWQQLWTLQVPYSPCAGKPYEMCRLHCGSSCWTSSHRSAWCTILKLAAAVL
jgi:hypothetical protein